MEMKKLFGGLVMCLLMQSTVAQNDTITIQLNEVKVSANRFSQEISNIPASVDVVASTALKEQVYQSADMALQSFSGINVVRPFGIFGSSILGMRGITGSEQNRVLVLKDGVPVNVSDLGRVNWNRFNPASLNSIEILRGPASSVHGSNAMGGVINMVSKANDTAKIKGNALLSYGTYNTISSSINLNGNPLNSKKLYYGINSFYRMSDGYMTQPDSLRDSTHIASWMNEFEVGLVTGYFINPNQKIEVQYDYYNDRRSQGEKILDDEGNYTDHDTHFVKANYSGNSNNLSWNIQFYYQQENYFRNAESFKKSYSLYQVNSIRKDIGFISNLSYKSHNNLISGGIDIKIGSVNGSDEYQTSSDIITNQGEMDQLSFYVFDQFDISDQFSVTGSLHYTISKLNKAIFSIENNSGNSDILLPFENDTSGLSWSRLSPQLAFQYKNKYLKIYTNYSTGFRTPTLDDLTRTGYIAGGFKIANPDLQPELASNFEIGSTLTRNKLIVSLSAFYTIGDEFMYYIETREFIGRKPILIKRNISSVTIYGAELSFEYFTSKWLRLYGNITYNSSTIKQFDEYPDLVGKKLTYSPDLMINGGFTFYSKYVNVATSIKYTSVQYMDDANQNTIPAITNLNIKLWYEFKFGLNITLSGENLLNKQYLIYYDQLSIGRFITGTVGYRF